MNTDFGDRKTSSDRLKRTIRPKKDTRTMVPLGIRFPTKLRDEKKVRAMEKALKNKQK